MSHQLSHLAMKAVADLSKVTEITVVQKGAHQCDDLRGHVIEPYNLHQI